LTILSSAREIDRMSAPSPAWRVTLARFLVVAAAVSALPAHAVPYFARKYETSCQTCHVAQPKLNDFGIAFRNNGYEWPGGEEEMTKQKPVVLSAEANKEAFPDAVWPSWFPQTLPLSLFMSESLAISDKQFDNWVSPAGLGSNFSVAAAGAISSGIAVHALIGVSTTAASPSATVSLPLAYGRFRVYKEFLSVRAGKLSPDLFTIPSQSISSGYWIYNQRLGSTGWSLGGRQGVELSSIALKGRLRTTAGASGSNGQLGQNWDGWAHVSTKIGGLRFDGAEEGQEEATTAADAMHPWRDNSVQLGASIYNGQSTYLPTPTAKTQLTDYFTHYGVDLDWWFHDANILVAYVTGRHTKLTPGVPPAWIHTGLAEVDYVVYPWFIPTLMFEYSDASRFLPYSLNNPKWHVVGTTNFLLVANARVFANVEVGPYSATPTGDTSLAFLSANLGISLGF
jgi:hypothetical protein